MRAGRVVYIRVGPMSCIDISYALEKIPGGMNPDISFSHAVSMVLDSCLAALKRDGIIPNASGFEYAARMQRFPVKEEARKAKASQIKFTNWESHPSHTAQPIVPEDPEARRFRIRFEELSIKYDTAHESMDEAELAELQAMMDKKATG